MQQHPSKRTGSGIYKNNIFITLKNTPYFSLAKTSGYLLLPLVLLLLPADTFDTGPTLCLSKLLAGIECFGCGMTRAIMHLIHLDFAAAAAFNKGCFIVFPVLSVLWAQWFRRDYKRWQQQRRHLRQPWG